MSGASGETGETQRPPRELDRERELEKERELFTYVVGLEPDLGATCFAAAYAAGAIFVDGSSTESRSGSAVVVRALSHALDPEVPLRELRWCCASDARLLIAEPRAHAWQSLEAPYRRAFSRLGLASLLVRTGWAVSGWLDDASTFVSCAATPSTDDEWRGIGEAQRLARSGAGSEGLELLSQLTPTADAVRLEVALAIADIAFNLGEGTLSLKSYLRAREICPNDARHGAGLARLSLAMGDTHDALTAAHAALRCDPADADAAVSLAIVLQHLGDPATFQAWDAAWRLAPSDAGVAAKAANAAGNAGRPEYAVEIFEHVRGYGDEVGPEFHVALGLLLARVGRFNDALVEARRARSQGAAGKDVTQLGQLEQLIAAATRR